MRHPGWFLFILCLVFFIARNSTSYSLRRILIVLVFLGISSVVTMIIASSIESTGVMKNWYTRWPALIVMLFLIIFVVGNLGTVADYFLAML